MRILMLSAGVGGGHNRAAEALAAVKIPGVETDWLDSLKYKSGFFRKLYADSYFFMANHSPALLGLIYKSTGKKEQKKSVEKLVKAYDRLAYGKLVKAIDDFNPDAVIATHFLPPNVLLARGRSLPIYVVVTDFDVHAFWLNRKVKGYFVASEEVKWQLRDHGIPEERIRVSGIPVHPLFAEHRGRDEIRREMGLPRDRPVVLFMSGGVGVGDMGSAVNRILALEGDYELVVVCGRNNAMKKKLESLGDRRLHVHGFVTNVHDFMEAADFAITKGGGLSVSECLARTLPMVILSPIPGQEERNCDYLLEAGAAVKAKGPEVVDFKVQELLAAPSRLATMKQAAEAVARPHAARDVLTHVHRDLS